MKTAMTSLHPARVIAITSGKGGVGKTHTTINLGLALTKMGKRVLLLDADLGLANINVLLGFHTATNVADVLGGKADLEQIIYHHPSGLDIIPASSGISELTDLRDDERLHLLSAVDDLAYAYDYLFIDTAAGIGDNVLYFNNAAEQVIVLIDEEPTSITDAYAVIKVLSTRCGVKRFQVLVNRADGDGRSAFGQLASASGKFLDVSMTYLGAVQEDSAVIDATRAQRPFYELYPSSRASLDIARVAKKLTGDETPRNARGGMQFFFRALVQQ